MSPDEQRQQRQAVPLRPGGGAVGALLAAREELEGLATGPGSLAALARARGRRDALARVVLELGFDPSHVARFAGVSDEYAERLASRGE